MVKRPHLVGLSPRQRAWRGKASYLIGPHASRAAPTSDRSAAEVALGPIAAVSTSANGESRRANSAGAGSGPGYYHPRSR